MEPFIGQIELFPYNFTPRDWLRCEGQLLNIPGNEVLLSLLGSRFGGNGDTNFALPDLRGKEPVPDTHDCIAARGIFPGGS